MQVFQCGGDCGWMVGEIVVDGDVVMVVDYFYVVFDVVEVCQCWDYFGWCYVYCVCGGQCGQFVEYVVVVQQ